MISIPQRASQRRKAIEAPVEALFDAGQEIVVVLVVGGESLAHKPLSTLTIELGDVDGLGFHGVAGGVPADDGVVEALMGGQPLNGGPKELILVFLDDLGIRWPTKGVG